MRVNILLISSVVLAFILGITFASLTGMASKSSCADSDGGINYNIKGTATKGRTASTDSCSSASNLVEYYCSGSSISQTNYNCANGCLSGACQPAQNQTPPTNQTTSSSCTDSDGGKIYPIKGTTQKGTPGTIGSSILSDFCVDSSTLKEGFCTSNDNVSGENYTCSNGCSEGRCL